MTTMQRFAAAGSGVALTLSLASGAMATSHPVPVPPVREHGSIAIGVRGHAELRGTVRSVDAGAKMFAVNVWGTEWRVRIDGETKLLSRGSASITMGDIAVGHLVHVVGRADPSIATTIIASRVNDLDSVVRRVSFSGSITALSPPDMFTFLRDGGGQLTVKLGTGAKIAEGDAVKTFSDLSLNLRVTVIGTYDLASNTLTASEVRVRPAKSASIVPKGRALGKILPKIRGPRN